MTASWACHITNASETKSEPISPIPLEHSQSIHKVALGNRLFHDPVLSRDQSVSCASCHLIDDGGDDNSRHSIGIDGQEGSANALTVLNSGANYLFFWDGRAGSLEEQLDGPIHNEKEMDSSWPLIIKRLKADQGYSETFANTYPDGITEANIKNAISSFQRSLLTPNAPFDKWLRGDETALTKSEQDGYKLFKEIGCISCHQGQNIGGNMMQKIGIINPIDVSNEQDLGYYNVTGKEEDKQVFRVPSLRNVALTAPYMHDGYAETLDSAVRFMAYAQLGRKLSEEEANLLVAFLNSLTGEIPDVHGEDGP